MNCTKSCCRRLGLTLIEVTAGLALLSVLLVATLMSFGRLDRQVRSSDRKLEACDVAEHLLSNWFSSPKAFPIGQQGRVYGNDKLGWRTRVLSAREVSSLNVTVVRLEIVDAMITERDQPALATVDVMLASPLWKQ